MIIKRLACVCENFASLANDFGVHLTQPEVPRPDRNPEGPGLDNLRTAIAEINVQIALIENQHERLYAARAQLFGVGDGQWTTATGPPLPNTPGNYGPIRQGDHRAH